jgi:hypothetical protein
VNKKSIVYFSVFFLIIGISVLFFMSTSKGVQVAHVGPGRLEIGYEFISELSRYLGVNETRSDLIQDESGQTVRIIELIAENPATAAIFLEGQRDRNFVRILLYADSLLDADVIFASDDANMRKIKEMTVKMSGYKDISVKLSILKSMYCNSAKFSYRRAFFAVKRSIKSMCVAHGKENVLNKLEEMQSTDDAFYQVASYYAQ